MAETKEPLTMKECYEELARVCRIIEYKQCDNKSLEFCRKTISAALDKLNKIQDEKAQQRARQKALTVRAKSLGGCSICGKEAHVKQQYGYPLLCMTCLRSLDEKQLQAGEVGAE